jgi:hypothetical protein
MQPSIMKSHISGFLGGIVICSTSLTVLKEQKLSCAWRRSLAVQSLSKTFLRWKLLDKLYDISGIVALSKLPRDKSYIPAEKLKHIGHFTRDKLSHIGHLAHAGLRHIGHRDAEPVALTPLRAAAILSVSVRSAELHLGQYV